MIPRSKCISAVLALVLLTASHVHAQPNPSLKPSYGAVTLKAGFLPDPFKKDLVAGGPIKTNLGGVSTHVAKAPDFSLNYTRGKYPLTLSVKSVGDTTLLVNLPDGTWVADDDGGGGVDPLLRFANPQSGRYDIYVGTFAKNPLPATLTITEIDTTTAPPPPTAPIRGDLPDCYIVSAGVDNYINANKLNGCLNDARNTVAAFKAQTGVVFRKVEDQTLLNASATRANIQQKFQALSRQGKANDFMVLFLSGHGARGNGDKTWFYLPFDFHPGNAAGTILTDTQILDVGDVLVKQQKKVVIIIDACFCGQLQTTAQRYLSNYKNGGGMILMLSSAAHQTSAALGNYSAFAKAFADAMAGGGDLNKDGKVTLAEIQTYSSSRTSQLLAQSRITERQDSIVAWSPSISRDLPFAYSGKLTTVAVKLPTSETPTRWAGSENLAGFGKLGFAMYPGGRAIMMDAKETAEGIWQGNDNQITLSFFDGAVVYAGTRNGNILSGTATSPSPRTNARKSWTWTVKLQSGG